MRKIRLQINYKELFIRLGAILIATLIFAVAYWYVHYQMADKVTQEEQNILCKGRCTKTDF